MCQCLLLLFVFTSQGSEKPAPPTIAWQSLLREATDLALLTELHVIPFTSHQVSSYDRRSVTPSDPENWFANQDGGHCLYEGTITQETPFYRTGPQQGHPPEGVFPAGTKVGIARLQNTIAGYVWAYATDLDGKPNAQQPLQGYIPRVAITPNPIGPVLADIQGPGCITRFWSADPGNAGKVRIFLDDAPTPVIEDRLESLLTRGLRFSNGIGKEEFLGSPWAGEQARGVVLLFPIPFSKRCLITVEKPDVRYQINYRRYPAGTPVTTFQLSEFAQQWPTEKAKQVFTPDLFPLAQEIAQRKTPDLHRAQLPQITLAPGDKKHLEIMQPPEVTGGRAILRLNAAVQAERWSEALRDTWLSITFDGAAEPQVHAPLGDFFGTAPGANSMSTLPLQVKAGGALTSRWIMPFRTSARLELHNRGRNPITVQLDAIHCDRPWTERSLHFHAQWRHDTLPSRPYQDWTAGFMNGQGHFVGGMLSVYNPVKGWWGEGDSKIWVDGEAFPSHWGTGTEEDFGLGWADRSLFSKPWLSQSRADGDEAQGFTSLFRCRLLDRIPFDKSLKYTLEVRPGQPNIKMQFAATTYWYARPVPSVGRDSWPVQQSTYPPPNPNLEPPPSSSPSTSPRSPSASDGPGDPSYKYTGGAP